MTILTPTVLPETTTAATPVALPASAPTASFDVLMAAESATPSAAEPTAAEPARTSGPAFEQAGALAACLLWTPAPLPPPLSAPALEGISAEPTANAVAPEVGFSAQVPSGPGLTPQAFAGGASLPGLQTSPDTLGSNAADLASRKFAPSRREPAAGSVDLRSGPLPRIFSLQAPTETDEEMPASRLGAREVPTEIRAPDAMPVEPGFSAPSTLKQPEAGNRWLHEAPIDQPASGAGMPSPTATVPEMTEGQPASASLLVADAPDGAQPVKFSLEAGEPAAEGSAAPDVTTATDADQRVQVVPAVLRRPAAHRPDGPMAGQEKNAELASDSRLPSVERPLNRAKTFVSTTGKGARVEEEIVGTSVAKTVPDMPTLPLDRSIPTPAPAAPAAVESANLRFDASMSAEVKPTVRETVEKVLSVIDAQEKAVGPNHRSVAMDFDFGGERLAVRVEFREGTVRAHFQASSSELRSAIASEWTQAAAGRGSSLHNVEPEFVTTRPNGAPSFGATDDNASRQQSRQSPPEPSPVPSSVRRFVDRPATITEAAPENLPRFHQSYTTRHLHTFA